MEALVSDTERPLPNLYKVIETFIPKEHLEEIERERLEGLKEWEDNYDDRPLSEQYPTGCKHEYAMLHLTSVQLNTFAENVLDDPVVLLDRNLYLLANVAFAMMFGLYQEIGAKALDKEDDDAS